MVIGCSPCTFIKNVQALLSVTVLETWRGNNVNGIKLEQKRANCQEGRRAQRKDNCKKKKNLSVALTLPRLTGIDDDNDDKNRITN